MAPLTEPPITAILQATAWAERMAGRRVDERVDARGLDCPLPVVEARRALNRLQAGDIVLVLATDPGAPADFQAFCRMAGHELLAFEPLEQESWFVLRKGGC